MGSDLLDLGLMEPDNGKSVVFWGWKGFQVPKGDPPQCCG